MAQSTSVRGVRGFRVNVINERAISASTPGKRNLAAITAVQPMLHPPAIQEQPPQAPLTSHQKLPSTNNRRGCLLIRNLPPDTTGCDLVMDLFVDDADILSADVVDDPYGGANPVALVTFRHYAVAQHALESHFGQVFRQHKLRISQIPADNPKSLYRLRTEKDELKALQTKNYRRQERDESPSYMCENEHIDLTVSQQLPPGYRPSELDSSRKRISDTLMESEVLKRPRQQQIQQPQQQQLPRPTVSKPPKMKHPTSIRGSVDSALSTKLSSPRVSYRPGLFGELHSKRRQKPLRSIEASPEIKVCRPFQTLRDNKDMKPEIIRPFCSRKKTTNQTNVSTHQRRISGSRSQTNSRVSIQQTKFHVIL